MKTLLNTFTEEIGSQQDQNFLEITMAFQKKRLIEEKTIVTQKLKQGIY